MGFDITVHQAGAVGVPHPTTSLDHQLQCLGDAETLLLLDECFQVGAWHIFHHDEKVLLVETKVVHSDNVWMGEVCGCLGFLSEAFAKSNILREIFTQGFNRHITLKHQVFGFVNNSHAARAQRLFKLVAIIKDAESAHTMPL